jgi:hypothetical protein
MIQKFLMFWNKMWKTAQSYAIEKQHFMYLQMCDVQMAHGDDPNKQQNTPLSATEHRIFYTMRTNKEEDHIQKRHLYLLVL